MVSGVTGASGTIDKETYLGSCRDFLLQSDWRGEDEVGWRAFLATPTGMKIMGILQLEFQAIGQQALAIRVHDGAPLLALATTQGRAQGLTELIEVLLGLSQPQELDENAS